MVQPLKASGPRVAFQGEPGAFSEEAALGFFADPQPVAVPTWRAIFEAVRDGAVEAGVAAIENSLAGTIRETYDLLAEFDVRIVGSVSVPIRLSLLALPGQKLEDIERVYSHAQALAQADEFLRTRPWQVLTTYNTAGAARTISERGERGAGAVASARVAGLYGLEVVAADIQTGADNRTRFVVLARDALSDAWLRVPPPAGAPMMTTLVFAVRNVPGSLHRCLGAFAARGLNLSRLESRPTRAARWEYVFWVDLDADAADPAAAAALDDLRREAAMVRILGSYARPAE
ncbi:MAG: prephenate dehydratase [Chloroflexota bacterium]|nr:prephenate dehydratase [Chloroflexota bacterium]